MRFHRIRAALILALGSALSGLATESRADPLLTQGIGLQSCAKLAPNLKPGAGLDHLPNALLFYWFQGYLSAANIHLLNDYTDYVDVGAVDDETITKLVSEFCTANPDKKPISAIDTFIKDAKKIEAKESDAFDPWEH
jgi:hypothetical protein